MKIKVPEGMLKAATPKDKVTGVPLLTCGLEQSLEDALWWLRENPIEPTDAQIDDMLNRCPYRGVRKFLIAEWQRLMFLAPEPQIHKWRQEPQVRVFPALNSVRNDLVVVFGVRDDGIVIQESEAVEFDDEKAKTSVIASLMSRVNKSLQSATESSRDDDDEVKGLMFGRYRQDVHADEANHMIRLAFRLGRDKK